ncbi:MAG: helix-turn-helix transcriptional regulator [Caulobacteraceae bacterium]
MVSAEYLDRLSDAVFSAGSPAFHDNLLAAIQHVAEVELLTSRAIDLAGPRMVGAAGGGPAVTLARALCLADRAKTEDYANIFRRAGCGRILTRRVQDGAGGAPVIDGIEHIWRRGRDLHLVGLFRTARLGLFSLAEQKALTKAGRLITSLISVHLAGEPLDLSGGAAAQGAIVDQVVKLLDAGLTRREAAVISRIVMGMRTVEIVADLGVKPATVNTLRQRAYAKLGVSRQAGLFARCVQIFSELQPGPGPSPTSHAPAKIGGSASIEALTPASGGRRKNAASARP